MMDFCKIPWNGMNLCFYGDFNLDQVLYWFTCVVGSVFKGFLNCISSSNEIGIPRTNSIGKVSDSSAIVTDNFPNSEDVIRRGEYAVIRSLIRVLEVFDFFFCWLLL